MNPTDALDIDEIADLAGVSPAGVRKWIRERQHHGFPLPWREGGAGKPNLWLRPDVEDWLRRTGRL